MSVPSWVVPWLPQQIQDGGGRHLEFRKNVNNFGLDKDILHQIIWEDAPRWRGDDDVTKSRNRKLIRVTSSNDCLKYMCVDLSDYNIYLNQIWYRTQIPHNTAAILNFGKMSILTLDWIKISCIKLYVFFHFLFIMYLAYDFIINILDAGMWRYHASRMDARRSQFDSLFSRTRLSSNNKIK